MAKHITIDQYKMLLDRNCNRSKHRLRTNHFGVTWCTYCGLLSTAVGVAQPATEDDQLIIHNDD